MRTPSIPRPAFAVVTLASLLFASACGASVFDLAVGDCFNASDSATQSTVETVECANPHTYEVYAVFDYTGTDTAYPGDDAMGTFAETECEARFEPWVGKTYAESELYVYYLSPSSDTWDSGDREVICAVYLPNEQLTGTQQGSGR